MIGSVEQKENNMSITKTILIKEYEKVYLCDSCGHKTIQNDSYCGGCGREIDSEEWECAIRMGAVTTYK